MEMEGQLIGTMCFGCASKDEKDLKKCGECAKSPTALMIPVYCSRPCQLKDWPVHKYVCAKNDRVVEKEAWRLASGDGVGAARFVATRDIEAGRIIFLRKTLLAFPVVHKHNQPRKNAVCFSCYEFIDYGAVPEERKHIINKCQRCGWPVHSSLEQGLVTSCEKEHYLSGECKLFKESRLTWTEAKKIEGIEESIGLLRAVRLPTSKLKELMSFPPPPDDFVTQLTNDGSALKTMRTFVTKTCKIKYKEIDQLSLILRGNTLPVPVYHACATTDVRGAFAVFEGGPTGRVLKHDCSPNCVVILSRDMKIGTFRTIKTVHKGDILSISYIHDQDQHIRVGVFGRTTCLRKLCVACNCPRCTTGDEDGTFLSALKGPDEGTLYLPERIINKGSGEIVKWVCPGKPDRIESEVIPLFLDATSSIRTALEKGQTKEMRYDNMKRLLEVGGALGRGNKTFHDDHEVVTYAKLEWGRLAIEIFDEKTIPNFQADFEMCKEFLPVIEMCLGIRDYLRSGWSMSYGEELALKAVFKMAELSSEIEATKGGMGIEDVDLRVKDALREFDDGVKMLMLFDARMFQPDGKFLATVDGHLYGHELFKRIDKYYKKEELVVETLQGIKSLRKSFGKPTHQVFKTEVIDSTTMGMEMLGLE